MSKRLAFDSCLALASLALAASPVQAKASTPQGAAEGSPAGFAAKIDLHVLGEAGPQIAGCDAALAAYQILATELPQAPTAAPAGGSPEVWLMRKAIGRYQLLFTDGTSQRFQIRELNLREPFLEIECETLAQVIESSLSALRSEASAGETAPLLNAPSPPAASALSRGEPGATTQAGLPVDIATRSTPRSGASQPSGERVLAAPFLLASYRTSFHSERVGWPQTLGGQLGLEWEFARARLGLSAAGEYTFQTTTSGDALTMRLDSITTLIETRALIPVLTSGWALGGSVGLGAEWTNAFMTALAPPQVTALSSQNWLPALQLGLLGQWQFAPQLAIELRAGVEVDVIRVRYVVDTSDGPITWLERIPVRPALRLGIRFH